MTKCISHKGHYDFNDFPIDDKGKPVLPGARICRHKDCVNQDHIISHLELERICVSYRTGQRETYQTQYNKLTKERTNASV